MLAAFWYHLSLKSDPPLSRLVGVKVEKRLRELSDLLLPANEEPTSVDSSDSFGNGQTTDHKSTRFVTVTRPQMQVNSEAAFLSNWRPSNSNWRIEGAGVRLGDKSRITSKDMFVGDFAVAIHFDHNNTWSNHLAWISVFGIRITPPRGRNILYLERRANMVIYRFGKAKAKTVLIKDSELETPSPLIVSSAHEAKLTILGMQLRGTALERAE